MNTHTDPVGTELAAIRERYAARPGDVERLVNLAAAVRDLVRDSDGNYLKPECYVPVGEFQNAVIDALTGPAGFSPAAGISDGPAPGYLKTWAEFWAPIVCRPDGTVNFGQLARELADYSDLMGWASEVYCHVTGERIGKVNTLPSAVISVADERTQELIDEEVGAAIDALIEGIEGTERGPLRTAEIVALIRELTGRQAGLTDD